MKYSAKSAIMDVFKKYEGVPLKSLDFYKKAHELGIFIPPAFNTHLSQLLKRGDLEKVGRSTYVYNHQTSLV